MTHAASQSGATLIEVSLVLGVVTLILLAVMTQTRGLWPLFGIDQTERMVLSVKPRAAALHAALQDWFVFEYCSGRSDPVRPPLGSRDRIPAGTPSVQDLGLYLYDGGAFLGEREQGTYEWTITRFSSPPQVRVYWTPPKEQEEFIETVARRLDAECDWPGCSRLVWASRVAVAQNRRNSLLQQWLARHGIDCDQDDDNDLDDFCDGDIDDNRLESDDDGNITSPTGQIYKLTDLDANADARLDFDFNLDLAVDSDDYNGWGC